MFKSWFSPIVAIGETFHTVYQLRSKHILYTDLHRSLNANVESESFVTLHPIFIDILILFWAGKYFRALSQD